MKKGNLEKKRRESNKKKFIKEKILMWWGETQVRNSFLK